MAAIAPSPPSARPPPPRWPSAARTCARPPRPPHPVRLLRQGLRAPRVRPGRSRHRAKSIRASARSVFLALSTPRLGRGARGRRGARGGSGAAREGANARPGARARRRERAPTSRPDASRVRRHRPRGPDRGRSVRSLGSLPVCLSDRRPPPSRNGREASAAPRPPPPPRRALPRPATGATRAATRTPRARPHRAPNAPRAPCVTSRSRPDRSTSRARDAALVGGARLGGKYQSSARAIPPLLYSPRRLSS